MIRRIIILLLIVGCGTEPEDEINFEAKMIGCWENDIEWDDNWLCFFENNIYYSAEEVDNGYLCSEPLNYAITDNELTIEDWDEPDNVEETIDAYFLTYTFSYDFNQILFTKGTLNNEEFNLTFKWTKWNDIEYTQFCP